MRRVWFEQRCGARKLARHHFPIEQVFERHGFVGGVEARTVTQQLTNRHRFLVATCKLGPKMMHRLVVRQELTFDTHGYSQRQHALCGAERQLQRVGQILACGRIVEIPTYDIDDQFATVIHRHAGTNVVTRMQIVCKCLANWLPACSETADNRHFARCRHGAIRVRRSTNATTPPAGARSGRSD